MGGAVLGLAGFLAGCAAATPAPRHAPLDIPPAAERPAAAPVDYRSLRLSRAQALAVERNPDLRAAAERIESARSRLGEAASVFYPQIGLRLSYVRTDQPAQAFAMIVNQRGFSPALDVNDPGATENVRPEIYGSVNLYRGGQDAHLFRAARYGVDATSLQRDAVRHALLEAVTAAYYGALAAREQMEVAAASLRAVEAELTDARTRFAAGAALKSDVLSLDVRGAAAREGSLRARHAVEQAKSALRYLLALPPEEPIDPAPAPDDEKPLPPTFAEALGRALHARPELRAAGAAVEARHHELEAERGAWLPRVDAFGAFGQDHDTFEFDHDQDNWTFGVVVELELFAGGRNRERVRGAQGRLNESRALRERTRLAVEQEVKTAMLAVEEARERLAVAEASVATAEEALRLVREQYAAGAATVTRFLEAEAALADARSRTLGARFDIRRAGARLRHAIGDSP